VTTLLKITTLGGLSIQRNDTPVTGFVSRKVDALLIYLVCNRREHPREALADLLWDDLTQARAMANLRMALSSLQQQLSDYVIVTRQSVMINPDCDIWLDTTALEQEIDAAEEKWERTSGLSRTGFSRLEEALSLYHGDFLAGFHLRDSTGFEDWKLVEQERIRGRVVDAMTHVVDDALEHNFLSIGIAQAKRLLQLDPLLEETHRQLMKLLARSGQRSAALAQYEACRKILEEELDVEPDDETVDLYEQISSGEFSAAPTTDSTPHNLPSQGLPFVGRDAELASIAERLDSPDCRLLTLLGPGGIGKTRLALQSASERLPDFRHGIFLVSLAPVNSPKYFISAIVTAIKLPVQSKVDLKDQLIDYLRDKEMLLVLDNFDQLLDAAEHVSDLLSAAPNLKIMVTSREVLNLQEEWTLQISGLAFPDSMKEDGGNYSAVQLFEQSARRVQAGFALNAITLPAVIRICQLVEGMPLALELAAAWLRAMPIDAIIAQIEHDLDFLTTTHRNVPERHRSIRVLFDHSWNLLSSAEQDVLMKLAVFRGGVELEAAQKVASATMPVLASLVEKSLLRSEGTGRYDLHELLRRFAYDKLAESGTIGNIQASHCDYFIDWAERLDIVQSMKQASSGRLDTDYDNLREALSWALEHQQVSAVLRLGSSLVGYWKARGLAAEGRRWLSEGLAISNDTVPLDLRAKALTGAGILAWSQSDFEPARLMLEISLKQYKELNDKTGMSRALNFLGYVLVNTGDYVRARLCYRQIFKLAQEQDDKASEATALSNLGMVSLVVGEYDKARQQLEESLVTLRQFGESEAICVALINLGALYMRQAEYAQAQSYYEEGLVMARALAHKPNIAITLANLGDVAHKMDDLARAGGLYVESIQILQELGDKLGAALILERFAGLAVDHDQAVRAATMLGAANRMRKLLRAPVTPRERLRYDETMNGAKTKLGDEMFTHHWDHGLQMSLDDAIHFALV
jgi:predicted ATPase/DNA-binding SARP family transcriptional activator/Tfp pilus assembly protein PilF